MKIFILICTLLFTACEDKTYTKVYQKSEINTVITSMSLSTSDKKIREIAKKALSKSGFDIQTSSPYSIDIEYRKYDHKCNNPQTATYDATYDGFVKLTLSKRMKKVFMVQKDFHGQFDESVIQNLLEIMKDKMQVKIK